MSVQRVRSSLMARIEPGAAALPDASNVVPLVRKAHDDRRQQARGQLWRDLSVMAAALLLGFFTVSTGVLDGGSLDPAHLTVHVVGEADDVSAVALGSSEDDLMQEEML
jgi:hypothetical protein